MIDTQILLVLVLAMLAFIGCQPADQAPDSRAENVSGPVSSISDIKKSLALDCLNDFFFRDFFTDDVYIEASEFVPSSLAWVGKYKAVVISRVELIEMYAEKDIAPMLASINIYESKRDPPNHFHIAINYGPVIVSGVTEIPYAEGIDYEYRVEEDSAVLVDKLHEIE